jgi:hypothetical protein
MSYVTTAKSISVVACFQADIQWCIEYQPAMKEAMSDRV